MDMTNNLFIDMSTISISNNVCERACIYARFRFDLTRPGDAFLRGEEDKARLCFLSRAGQSLLKLDER
jgi:hypothetical protein